MSGNLIYLDNNATTKVDPMVLEAMLPFLTENYANASSTHQFGLVASDAVKNARKSVASLINAEPHEITFTSGATESINIALKGVAEGYSTKGKHIITLVTEHTAVLDCCKYLETIGYEVDYLPVKKDGLIDLRVLKDTVREDTILVSVMLANNETGVIQPVSEISKIAHSVGALFFCDATQAVGKIGVDVVDLGIDILCLSGHKIYAPKGIGALYLKSKKPNKVKIPALIHGGGHERGLRSGTLNVPGIIALGKACEIAIERMLADKQTIENLRNYIERELLTVGEVRINGDVGNRMYNVTNLCFTGIDSDAIIIGLSNPEDDNPAIAVSNGSACTSASIDPSHVLLAMGMSPEEAFSSIRFSIGRFNTKDEMEIVVQSIKDVIQKLRLLLT